MKNTLLFLCVLFINKAIQGQCPISCPSNIFQVAPAGQCGAVIVYTEPGSVNCRPATLAFEGNPRYGQAYDEKGMHIAANEHIDAPWPVAGGRRGARIHENYTSTWTYKSGQPFTPVSVLILSHPGDHQFRSSNGATISPAATGLFTFPNTPEWRNITSLQWNNLGRNDDLDIDDFTFSEFAVIQTAGLPSGSLFPVGITINSFEIKDMNGNISTCSFTVTVLDVEDPVITVPADVTVDVKPHQCGAVVTFDTPVVTDNCNQANVPSVRQTAGLPSGSIFPIGTTINTFLATDAAGNTSSSSFSVTVKDNEIPLITVPADITVRNDLNQCSAIVNYDLPVVTDNCGRDIIVNGSFENDYAGWKLSSTVFGIGTFGILSAGQTIAPGGQLFNYASNTTVQQTSPGLPYAGNPTDGNKLAIFLQNGPAVHRMYQDITLPSTGNLTLNFDLQYRNHAVFDTLNQFFSVVLRDPATDVIIATIYKTRPGDPLSIPMTNKAIDISAYAGQHVRLDMIYASINLFFFDILLDNIKISGDIMTITQTSGLASGSSFPVGTTTNTFTATDASGNTGTSSFTVTVIDSQPPVVTVPAAITVSNDPNECGAVVTFDLPVVTENCGQRVIIQDPIINGSFENNYTGWNLSSTVPDFGTFGILSAGQTIPPGGQLFDYADDRIEQQTSPGLPYTGNPTEGTKLAILLQNGPAIHRMCQDITLPDAGDLILSFDLQYTNHASFDANNQFVSVVLRDPATDVIIATLYKTQPGDPLSIPMTTKTADVSAYAGQTVRLDMIFATITFFNLDVLLDNVKISGKALAITQVSGLPSGSLFPIGTTTNAFKATDASGNTAIDSFTVTVTDSESPVMTVPADIIVNKNPDQPGAIVYYQQPVVTDNCKKDLIINGSFEDNYTGWHISSTVASNGTFGILDRGQTISAGGQLFDYADNRFELQSSPGLPYTGNPTDGNKVAILLPNGPASHRMYQDIILPSAGSLTLSFDLQYRNHFQGFDAVNQFFSVVLRNPETDVIIATLFKTQPGDPLFSPMTRQIIDISAYAGQAVRLDMIFATFNNFYFDVLMDNIKITGNDARVTQISGLPSGSVFPVGTTTNTFIVTDESGNTQTGSFTVTVIDDQQPVITGAPYRPSRDGVALKGNPVKGLQVKAMPNPASGYFTLLTQSGSDNPLQIRVMDGLGRVIEAKSSVAANGRFQLGHNYRPGLYYLEVKQGKQSIIMKLIKQSE